MSSVTATPRDEDDREEESEEARTPHRRHRLRTLGRIAFVAAFAIAVIAAVVRTPSPVGHWSSAEGQTEFEKAYDAAFSDLPPTFETFDVRTDYGIVRVYRFEGTAPEGRAGAVTAPLVLLPGTASATPVWAANLPSLLEISDVYTIDLLGEPGMSVQSRPIADDADQAAWLHQVIAALPEPEVHLLGLSIGGWTATNLALHDDEGIASLTLLDPIHVFDDMPFETIVRSIPASVSWLPKAWRDDFNSWVAGGAPVEDVPVADMIEAGMRNYTMTLPQPTRITEEALGDLTVPTLAILAGRSVMHDTDTAVATAETALGADRVVLYGDATHAINGEYPDEIAADIADFLRSLG
ncbi:alpha/beta fold hydrolase [Microbacterium sp. PMB16]|uniref:alpha/beta fold hydrolase n=1 Tax=Microbacterium sp. PMB16 TaxID=3120157 RepID=UPI003F4CA546